MLLFLRRVPLLQSLGGFPCALASLPAVVTRSSDFSSVAVGATCWVGGGPRSPLANATLRCKSGVSLGDISVLPWWSGTSKRPSRLELCSNSDFGGAGAGEGDKSDRQRWSLFSYNGCVDYYDTADGVAEWCHSIRDVWGFGYDAEWDKQDAHSENTSPLALLQFVYLLKGEVKVALIHVSKIKKMARPKTKEAIAGIPLPLKQFLENRGKHKAGCNLWPDVEKFQTHHAIKFRGLLDMDPGPNHRSIKTLMAMLFQVKLNRNPALSVGQWSKDLTQDQLHYAANNAFAAFLVFWAFKHAGEAYFWEKLGLQPDPVMAAMLCDDARVHHISGW